MTFKIFFILLLSLCFTNIYSQNDFELVIIDSANVDDLLYIGEAYYEKEFTNIRFESDSSIAVDKKYSFTGTLDYPSPVRIFFKSKYKNFNTLLFLEQGVQKVIIKQKDGGLYIDEFPKNTITKEYLNYLTFFKIDEIDSRVLPDSLMAFTKRYQTSYISLYALINQTFNYGYSPIFYEIANQFSPKIKATRAFEYYKSQYLNKIQIPEIKLLNKDEEMVSFFSQNKRGQHTLIEFWFIGCSGCAESMRELKNLYSEKSLKNTRFVSISIDEKKKISAGAKFLADLGIPWECYWDEQGKTFKKFISLYMFPTNILLNSDGKIIAKDIRNEELVKFF